MQALLVDGSVRFIPGNMTQGPATSPGDPWGRYGNIWAAANYPNGIKEGPNSTKETVVWP